MSIVPYNKKIIGGNINYARVARRGGLLLLCVSAGYWIYEREMELQSELRREREAHDTAVKSGTEGRLGNAQIGAPFKLLSHTGVQLSDSDFHGRFMLIYFGFTNCPDICPEEMDKMGDALAGMDDNLRNMVVPIFVTCDPERDDPATIREYLNEFKGGFVGFTGSSEDIGRLAKAYRVYYKPAPRPKGVTDYLVDHSIYIFLMDPEGGFADLYNRSKTPEVIANSLTEHVSSWLGKNKDARVPDSPYRPPELKNAQP